MNKFKIVFISLILGILVIVGIFFVVGYFKPNKAGLIIETNPSSLVYIDGVQVGRTRYEITRKPGEVVIKLIPESMEKALAPYETKVNLVSGVKTIIQRDFAEHDDDASGVIISFEKTGGKEAEISLVSLPDSAQITIDAQVRGFTPFKSTSVTAGEHNVILSAVDYYEKSVEVRTHEGYKLTAVFKLAPNKESGEKETENTPTPEPAKEEVKVVVLETSTGFLRVRAEPSTLGQEIGQVKPGVEYLLLDTDEETGWFKIQFQSEGEVEKKEGWISNQYAKRLEKAVDPTPTPTIKPKPTP